MFAPLRISCGPQLRPAQAFRQGYIPAFFASAANHRRATFKRPAADPGMASLLSTSPGCPRKVAQPPLQTKQVHVEVFNHLDLTYNGVHAEDGCLVLFVPSGQLLSRLQAEADRTLGLFRD